MCGQDELEPTFGTRTAYTSTTLGEESCVFLSGAFLLSLPRARISDFQKERFPLLSSLAVEERSLGEVVRILEIGFSRCLPLPLSGSAVPGVIFMEHCQRIVLRCQHREDETGLTLAKLLRSSFPAVTFASGVGLVCALIAGERLKREERRPRRAWGSILEEVGIGDVERPIEGWKNRVQEK